MNDKNSRCCRDEPGDHALGRSRGGLNTKIHAAVDGRGRPLVILLRPGQAGDAPMMLPLPAGLRVGRPRTRPDCVLADKAYSSRGIRAHLRARGIGSVIPEPDAENLRSGKEWQGSADIAAHDRALGLMLLDCTRTVPDAVKADHLSETARYLRTRLNLPVRAAIVTPADVVASRPERALQGVAVIDGADLEELHSLVVNGNVEAARNHLGVILDHATRHDAV